MIDLSDNFLILLRLHSSLYNDSNIYGLESNTHTYYIYYEIDLDPLLDLLINGPRNYLRRITRKNHLNSQFTFCSSYVCLRFCDLKYIIHYFSGTAYGESNSVVWSEKVRLFEDHSSGLQY
jgi:hypothetical protein